MRKPLLALTAAAFGIGTSEFIIVGLLPTLAHDFAVSIPMAGTLVTAYALSVTFGSPVVAVLMAKVDRKTSLLWMMGLLPWATVFVRLRRAFTCCWPRAS